MKTFPVKLGCENCGHDSLRDIPYRHIIEGWEMGEDGDERFSSIHPFKKPEMKEYINCPNCGLAKLKVWWWKEEVFIGVENE